MANRRVDDITKNLAAVVAFVRQKGAIYRGLLVAGV